LFGGVNGFSSGHLHVPETMSRTFGDIQPEEHCPATASQFGAVFGQQCPLVYLGLALTQQYPPATAIVPDAHSHLLVDMFQKPGVPADVPLAARPLQDTQPVLVQ
jgi:hypothetical protein